jgi:site-specific recombinase XerD
MKVNFYLKDKRATYGTWIYCYITYQNKKVTHYTDKKIEPKHWNLESQQVRKSHPSSAELNFWLKDIRTFVAKLELEWSKKHSSTGVVPIIPPTYLKENLDKYFTKTTKEEREEHNQKSFWGYYNQFLNRMNNGTRVHLSKGTPMAPKTIFQFENLKRHLENYQKTKKTKIEFDKIDLTFYKDFVEYLTTKLKLAPNTIGKLITNLKVFLREAFDEGITTNNIFANRRFRSNSSLADTIYLTPVEIKEISNLDLKTNLKLDRVRDMFIIGCYTGLRFSDIVNIKPEHINDGMIEITQVKTKEKVAIPMTKEVERLLSKYNNSLHKISNQKFNDYLYEVVKKCEGLEVEVIKKSIQGGKQIVIKKPKYEFVSSHTARRSFATNEYMAKGLNVRDIMAITGHKTEKSFYKYIRQTPKENAERVKIIWKEREVNLTNGNLRVV